MNKCWVEAEKARLDSEAQAMRMQLVGKINSADFLTEKDKQDVIAVLDNESDAVYGLFAPLAMVALLENHKDDNKFDATEVDNFLWSIGVSAYSATLSKAKQRWERYLDSEKIEFDGDIIITDPRYIIRAEHHGTEPITEDDWEACGYGEDMGVFGFTRFLIRDTLYGDWGCTVYNIDTKERIGEFCADAGLVSVFLLDEVLKYNPDFDYHIARPWTAALIRDFKGTVQFVVERKEGKCKEGTKWENFCVHVVGHGISKRTGAPINFYSSQSSL